MAKTIMAIGKRSFMKKNRNIVLIGGGTVAAVTLGIVAMRSAGAKATMTPSSTIDGNTPDAPYTVTLSGFAPNEQITMRTVEPATEPQVLGNADSSGSYVSTFPANEYFASMIEIINDKVPQLTFEFRGIISGKAARLTMKFINWILSGFPLLIKSVTGKQDSANPLAATFVATLKNINNGSPATTGGFIVGIHPDGDPTMLAYSNIDNLQQGGSTTVTLSQAVPYDPSKAYVFFSSFAIDTDPFYDTSDMRLIESPPFIAQPDTA